MLRSSLMMTEREELVLWDPEKAKRERWTPALLAGAMICYSLTGLMGLVMLLGPAPEVVSQAVGTTPDQPAPPGRPASWSALETHAASVLVVEARPQPAPVEDGMRPVHWEVVRTYGTIEHMKAKSPTLSKVDNTWDGFAATGRFPGDPDVAEELELFNARSGYRP